MLKINATIHLKGGNHAHVKADSPEELHRALIYFATIGVLPGVDAAPVQAEPPVHPDGVPVQTVTDEQAAADKAAAEEAKPKRTRKPKEEKADAEPKAEPEGQQSAAPAEKSADGDKAVTIEDAAAAITEVGNKLGLKIARDMLDIFKVKRAGELKPEQYASFVKECRDLLGDKPEEVEDASTLL